MKQSPVVTMIDSPGSLLSQYKLLRAVIDAPWATRLDIKITSHVIDRYFGKYEVARASLRYLELATGATRTNIIESLSRIAAQGVINVARKGIGTRPTEYGLNFDFAKNKKPFAKNNNPVGPADSGTIDDTSNGLRGTVDNTSSDGPSGIAGDTSTSGIVGGTSCGIAGDTSSGSSGIVRDTESYLLNVLTSTLKVSRNEETPAVPTAPPVSGLEAHTAATAVDPEEVAASGFPELWAAYPRKHDRSKAQAAYRALAPDATLHATLVAKATQWAAHYEQTATEKRWWKHLHNWLAEERYLEDLPVPFENPKEAAIARKRENAPHKASKKEAVGKSGVSPKTPIGQHKVRITNLELTGSSFDLERQLIAAFKIEGGDHDGKTFSHALKYVSSDEDAQATGQSLFADLRNATGVLDPEDTSDFHGKTLSATVKAMGRIEYAASPSSGG